MQELLFLGGFIVFIVAILLVDMLAIDRKAHVVSIKEAGIWTGVWIILAWVSRYSCGFMATWYTEFTISTIFRL